MKASLLASQAIMTLVIAVASVDRGSAQTPPPPVQAAPAPARASAWVSDGPKAEQMILIERATHDAAMAEKAAKIAAESVKFRMKGLFGDDRNHELDEKIRQASAQVRDAKDDSARTAATADLTKLLDEYFEADIRVREQELAGISARLEKLRAQLDRRREKKSEIIELQVRVAINEADGLGFYSQPKDTKFNFRVQTPVMISPSGDALMVPPTEIPTDESELVQ